MAKDVPPDGFLDDTPPSVGGVSVADHPPDGYEATAGGADGPPDGFDETPKQPDPGEHLATLLFGQQSRTVDAAERLMEATKASIQKIAEPLTTPMKTAKTPAERLTAPIRGVAGFAMEPFMKPIPGMEALGEKTADAIQPISGIEEEAFKTGKTPYGKIAKRMAAEGVASFIPKTPLDVIAYAMPLMMKGGAAEAPGLLKGAMERPIETTAVPVATKELPIVDPKGLARKEPYALFQGNFDLGEGNAYSTYKIYGEHPRTGGNFGSADLEKMGVPIIGKEPRVPEGVVPIPHEMAASAGKELVPVAEEANPVKQVSDRIVRNYRGEKGKYTFDSLYQDTVNRFHSIEKLTDMAQEGYATKIKPGENPTLLARSYLGLKGKVDTVLDHAMFRMDPAGNVQFTGPGFKEVLKPMESNLDDLSTYLTARRAVNLAGRRIETGVPLDAAQKSVALLEAKHPQIAQVADQIQAWQDGLLTYLKDSGRIGQANYDAIKAANDFYAPMQRVLEEDPLQFNLKNKEIFNRVVSPIKKIEGSERKIVDPLEGMVRNAYQIMDAADRNRVAKAVLSLRSKNPELSNVLQVVKKPGKDTITAYFAGSPVHYKAPPDLINAMRGLSEDQAGMIAKILGFPTRVLRAGATLSPEFAIRNPIRDQWTAMVNSRYGYKPGYDALRGMFSAINADDAFWKWQASGGAQSFLVSMDRNISDLLHAPPANYWQKYGEYIKNPLKVFQDVSVGLEEPTRVGLFKRASQSGASDLEAGFESREGTVDFARRGAKMRAINSIYAFFNARLQGVDKTIRAFKANPGKATLAAAPLTAASILLYLNNRSEPDFKEIPQWQKDLFWLFKVKGKWIRIPKGDVGLIFGSTAEHVMDWMDNNEPGKMASFAYDTLSNISPVDFNNGGLLPNFVRPIVENVANYNYFLKRSIVSEGRQRLLPEYQFSQFDSEAAKQIGKLLKVSPSKVSNLILGYTGGMGRLGLQAIDKAGQAVGALQKPPETEMGPENVPGVKGFFMTPPSGSSSQSVADFYDNWESIQQAFNTIKQNPDDMDKISKDHPEWVLYKNFQKTSEALSNYRKIRNDIMGSDKITPVKRKEEVEKINAEMTNMARSAMDTLYEFKKKKREAQ